jgi:hypothetical protein
MVDLVVTVRDGADIHRVAENLAKAGFSVADKMEAIGVISGSASTADIIKLQAVDGVGAVEESMPVQLPPP